MPRPPREITAHLIADAIALLERHPPEAVARRLRISMHVVQIVARQARDPKWRERADPQSASQRPAVARVSTAKEPRGAIASVSTGCRKAGGRLRLPAPR